MKKTVLRQGFDTGITFGIIHIFCVLIAFNAMLGGLLVKIVGIKSSMTAPLISALITYAAVLGIWAGLAAAQQQREASNGKRLQASLMAGVSSGLLAALLVAAFQVLLAFKIDARNYLANLSLPFMKACSYALSPFLAVLANFATFLLSALVGGLLVVGWNLIAPLRHKIVAVPAGWVASFKSGPAKTRRIWKYVLYVVVFAVIAILPIEWGSYWNYVMGTVGLYVILGLGLNIIVGLSGQLVLGYIAFFAIGAYTVALLNAPLPHNLFVGFWPSLVLGVLLAAFAGFLLGLPLMRLRGDYLAIVTLGFGEIIRILLNSDVLTSFSGGPRGVQGIHGPTLFGHAFNDVEYMYLIILAVALAMYVYNRLQHSRSGRAWLAIREDETVAQATGVNTSNYKLLSLMLGAGFAGLAGGISAAMNQFIGPADQNMMASINVLCEIIVGGMGNIPGTLLGAFALKGLPELLREVENYRMLAFGALLVIMMIIRPDGLIPSRRPSLELPEAAPAKTEADNANSTSNGEKSHDR